MNDLTNALHEFIPTSLDSIIRTNRHLVKLRLANDQELAALSGKVVVGQIKDEISDYRLVSIVLNNPDHVSVHLLGTCSMGSSWATSQVTLLDDEQGYAATRSGSIYKLVGCRARDEPGQDDLICMCATLTKWGLGPLLGIPAFFY